MLTPFLSTVQRCQSLTVSGNFSALIFYLMRKIGFIEVISETDTHKKYSSVSKNIPNQVKRIQAYEIL